MARPSDPPWVTAAEVGDYAFCPRSFWYRHHPPPEGPAPDARRRSSAGERYHASQLAATERRSRHGLAYWLVVLFGALAVLGGIAWLLH